MLISFKNQKWWVVYTKAEMPQELLLKLLYQPAGKLMLFVREHYMKIWLWPLANHSVCYIWISSSHIISSCLVIVQIGNLAYYMYIILFITILFSLYYRLLNCILSFILVWWFGLNNVTVTIGEFRFFSVRGVKVQWNDDPGLVCDTFFTNIFY